MMEWMQLFEYRGPRAAEIDERTKEIVKHIFINKDSSIPIRQPDEGPN